MRPGRYPADHPLEEQARTKLYEPTAQAQAKLNAERQATFEQIVRPARRSTSVTQQTPSRWR